jgi:hypothetical protein
VDADDGPVDDRAPPPDLPGIGLERGGGHLRRGGGKSPGFPVEPLLGRRVVEDLVLGLMARRGVDIVRQHDARGAERQRQRQDEPSAKRAKCPQRAK